MTTERRRKPRATPLPITTVSINEEVTINLRGRRVTDQVHQYGGKVLAVDGYAIRVEVHWSRLALSVTETSGEIVFPWHSIDRIVAEVGG